MKTRMAQLLITFKMIIIIKTKEYKLHIMKKYMLIALTFFVATFSFAQKKELRTAEKALKNNNYAEAKATLNQLDGLLSSMDDKMKSQYYLLKAQALFAGGAGTNTDITEAIAHLKLVGSDNASEAAELQNTMESAILTNANNSYQNRNFDLATEKFLNLYKLKPQDTAYLYYAASSAVSAQNMDKALTHYLKLKEMGYTGVEKQYFAINKETGEEEIMDKAQRDLLLKSGAYIKPGERMTSSRLPEITQNIAIIYLQKKETDKALEAIKEARAVNPDNVELIITEANLYLDLKDSEKFTQLMKDAVAKQPNNAALHYNIGVMNMQNSKPEDARASFEKALELDPTMADAALNISTTYIDQGNALIEEMNKLGTSAADNKKYDELRAEKTTYFEKGAKVLEQYIKSNPESNVNIYEQLKNIYNALGDVEKSKAIKAKIEAMQN